MRHKRGPPPMTGRPPFKPAALFTFPRFSLLRPVPPHHSPLRPDHHFCRPQQIYANSHRLLTNTTENVGWNVYYPAPRPRVGSKCANDAALENTKKAIEKRASTMRSIFTTGDAIFIVKAWKNFEPVDYQNFVSSICGTFNPNVF